MFQTIEKVSQLISRESVTFSHTLLFMANIIEKASYYGLERLRNGVNSMNHLQSELLKKANEEAIYNIYLYLAHKKVPAENESLQSIVFDLEAVLKNQNSFNWKSKDIFRLKLLKNAVETSPVLANSRISNLTYSENGLTACVFTKPNGDISVVFKGTGSGEWIDNGEGLSGMPEENTYITYPENDGVPHSEVVTKDYATDQQVEALNWFLHTAAKNGWEPDTNITVSGHSKGGNKAQFVTIHSDLPDACYSFDGQGFSPEALSAFKKQRGEKYEERRQRIRSFSTDNDYVNVLGRRLVPENNIFYFKARAGIHYMEAMLDKSGFLRPQCEQGRLSAYAEKVSNDLMNLNPLVRQYATLGIMNIFQKYLGKGLPVNGDAVSTEKTIAGIGIAVASFLRRFPEIY